jgi:hypothetical protein
MNQPNTNPTEGDAVMTSTTKRKMIRTQSIFGEQVHVLEGTLLTRSPYEQWHGWSSEGGRRQRGLREEYTSRINDLQWTIGYIEKMIAAGLTHTWPYDGETEKLIDDYEEEDFYESLEDLRDGLNDTLNAADARRPLKRRIALAQQMIDLRSEPADKAAAQGRIEVLMRRLEEGEASA